MEKRICWKKGMRLTDDIMRASEDATAARIGNAMALASAGRFGLLPSPQQFQLSLNISAEAVEVQALNCLAVTRGGYLVDVQFDTKYTNHIESRVYLPDEKGTGELLLTISVDPKQWKETINGYEEPVYTFDLVGVNSPIPDNALPIAHLVYWEQARAWRIDEEDFVPPCLFVSSSWKYEELLNQFVQKLSEVEAKVFVQLNPGTHEAFRIFWPVAQQILIDTDKGRDLMTPIALLGNIQKYIAIFTASCHLDQYLNLSDAEMFRNYALSPYNYMNVYPMIKEGLRQCFMISEKIDKMIDKTGTPPPPPPPMPGKLKAPSIADDQLYQNCKSSSISIPVINNEPGASMYYSCDGSMPSKSVSGGKIRIKNTFNSIKEPEPDQEVIVKLKAVLDNAESDISSFTVILHKDYNVWIKI